MHRPLRYIMEARQKVVGLIKGKTGLEEVYCRDMEIGIYNWCISECLKRRVVKNWANPKFSRLYAEKARSVLTNIDSGSYVENTGLIERLKEKEFCPHDVAFMRPENTHPERWSNSVSALMKKYENAYEQKAVAMTDMFKCGKCKKRECTFFELQCRSGDEATTIFIKCVNCGHSWRQG